MPYKNYDPYWSPCNDCYYKHDDKEYDYNNKYEFHDKAPEYKHRKPCEPQKEWVFCFKIIPIHCSPYKEYDQFNQ